VTVQFVLNKYSDALLRIRHDAARLEPCVLCCTESGYAGCVPRTVAAGRTYGHDPTSVGPKLARSNHRKSIAQAECRFSLWTLAAPVAVNPPYPHGT
jgi:hypothetical protein